MDHAADRAARHPEARCDLSRGKVLDEVKAQHVFLLLSSRDVGAVVVAIARPRRLAAERARGQAPRSRRPR